MDVRLRVTLLTAIVAMTLPGVERAGETAPGCGALDARACVGSAIAAMGGEAAVRAVHGARITLASDTLVLGTAQNRVYDPELTFEVMQAVRRNRLAVDRVWAMHQEPVAWSLIARLMAARPTG